jgi:Trk K+ transport system NAD-binding subunit/nucleotide-binding universal stress UspA family protein
VNAVLVGAGGTARELLRRLGDMWSVTVVDTSEKRLLAARNAGAARAVVGDGASRVVLERAGLRDADAVIAATNDDDVNIEVCRIAQGAGVLRIAAMAADPERLPDYQKLGVVAYSPDQLTARRLELNLETRRIVSQAFADGRAEAIEFRIAHDSPIRRRALREIHSDRWLIGAVLRGDELIVPHGDTVLEPDDLVTVIGSALDFGEIVRTFTSGEARFPLEFGSQVVAVPTAQRHDPTLDEAAYLTRTTRAVDLIAVLPPSATAGGDNPDGLTAEADGVELRGRHADSNGLTALSEVLKRESVGVIVFPGAEGNRITSRWTTGRRLRVASRKRAAVLFARAGHPYRRILLLVGRTAASRAAAQAAIDIARMAAASLVALAPVEPFFVAGREARDEASRAVGLLQEEAAAQRVNLRAEIREGNPVRLLVEMGAEADLVVVGADEHVGLFRIRLADHVARRAPTSVLVVPAPE